MAKVFSQSELQAIADALGETSDGLTGSEIGHLLKTCSMADPTPARNVNGFLTHSRTRKMRNETEPRSSGSYSTR